MRQCFRVYHAAQAVGPSRAGDEDDWAAIVENMLDLRRFEEWVDRYKYATRLRCCKHRDHGFELLGEVHCNAVVWLQPERGQPAGRLINQFGQLRVAQRCIAMQQGSRVGCALGGFFDDVMEQKSHAEKNAVVRAGV